MVKENSNKIINLLQIIKEYDEKKKKNKKKRTQKFNWKKNV
jgi:hypothetical protein